MTVSFSCIASEIYWDVESHEFYSPSFYSCEYCFVGVLYITERSWKWMPFWCLSISLSNSEWLVVTGVYLPLLWEPTFCWRTPLALGYTRGHFSALVPMEADLCAHLGARANIDTNDDAPTIYLPLMDYEGKILPVHFLQLSEVS